MSCSVIFNKQMQMGFYILNNLAYTWAAPHKELKELYHQYYFTKPAFYIKTICHSLMTTGIYRETFLPFALSHPMNARIVNIHSDSHI